MSNKSPGLKETLGKIDIQAVLEDFRHLNPNDPGAWPLVPKVVILIGFLLLLLVGGWWFLWDAQLTTLSTAETEEQTLKDQYLVKKRQQPFQRNAVGSLFVEQEYQVILAAHLVRRIGLHWHVQLDESCNCGAFFVQCRHIFLVDIDQIDLFSLFVHHCTNNRTE